MKKEKQTRNRTNQIGNWISAKIVSEMLGIGKPTFYFMIKKERFNFKTTKFGVSVYYWKPDVENFIEKGDNDKDKNN